MLLLVLLFTVFFVKPISAMVSWNASSIVRDAAVLNQTISIDTTLYPLQLVASREPCPMLSSFNHFRGHVFHYQSNSTKCVTATANGLDPMLLVYNQQQECVAMNDDVSRVDFSSRVHVHIQPNQTYHFLVAGAEQDLIGKMEFRLQEMPCTTPTANAWCPTCQTGEPQDLFMLSSQTRGWCEVTPINERIVDGTNECRAWQTISSSRCLCPVVNDPLVDSCPLCQDHGEPNDNISILGGISCGLVHHLPTCDNTGLSAYCECPGSPPCHLCGSQTENFDATLIVQELRGLPLVTCGTINEWLQREVAWGKSCDSSWIDDIFGVNVVDFCCFEASFPTVTPQETQFPTCPPTTKTAYPTTTTRYPSVVPSMIPSDYPSLSPSSVPSVSPSTTVSNAPSHGPTVSPSLLPSMAPPTTDPGVATLISSGAASASVLMVVVHFLWTLL